MAAESEPTPSVDPRIGRVLQGRYRILAPIGEGAMGTVYRAERLTLGRQVAIKFLLAELAKEPLLVKRFEVEARAMASLSHPNCVSVIDFGVDQSPYLVMDLVPGKSLRAIIQEGPVPVPRAIRIARQILAALSHAHDHGIIHRDIKPENVAIADVAGIEDHVLVLDFGLAKIVRSQLKLTMGMMLGTPNYMAPELTHEGAFDARVDLYATGIVLFEMLTGLPPFQAPDLGEVLLRILTMPVPRVREVRPGAGFSAELERVLLRSMAKDPAQRFSSASTMGAALGAIHEAEGSTESSIRPAVAADTIAEPLPRFLREPASTPKSPPVWAQATSRKAIWVAAIRRSVERIRARVPAATEGLGPIRGAVARRVSMRMGALRLWIGRSRRTKVAVISCAVVASLAVVALVARPVPQRGDEGPGTAPFAAPGPPAGVPVVPVQSAQDERERKIERLIVLRRSEPRNAQHAVELAQLYFEKRWWSAGLDSARAAIRIDPKRKSDPALIKQVIRALGSERAGDEAAECLREMGAAARPLLREAAENDPRPPVRARAADLLQSSERTPLFGGGFGQR